MAVRFINNETRILRETTWNDRDYELYATEERFSWNCLTSNFHKLDDNHTHFYVCMYGMQNEDERQVIDMLEQLLHNKKLTNIDINLECNAMNMTCAVNCSVDAFRDDVLMLNLNPVYECGHTKEDFYENIKTEYF